MAAAKLAVVSDLHLPITAPTAISQAVADVAAFGPDAVVIAGDMAESYADVERCLALVRDGLRCPIWALAGDHDLWARQPYDSRTLWLEKLPQVVAARGCKYLEGTGFILGETAVAGTIAWYDYSAVDPSIEATALEFAQSKYLYNADALRIDWEWSDREFADMVAAPFLAALEDFQADAHIQRIVVVTHMPLLEEQIVRRPENREWAFLNAYAGNLTLGRKVLAFPKVSHIVSGHAHVGRQCRIERGESPPVMAHVIPSDYENPGWVALTL